MVFVLRMHLVVHCKKAKCTLFAWEIHCLQNVKDEVEIIEPKSLPHHSNRFIFKSKCNIHLVLNSVCMRRTQIYMVMVYCFSFYRKRKTLCAFDMEKIQWAMFSFGWDKGRWKQRANERIRLRMNFVGTRQCIVTGD